jgi:hypothetical protein
MQDERVRVCTEVLQGIRVVKMHAWEAPLLERIRVARSVEMQKLGTRREARSNQLAS